MKIGWKEDTWIGSDRGGGDLVECIIIPIRVIWIFWMFKRSNRVISIVERNI